MTTKSTYADCPDCGFPISGHPGQAVICPMCKISGTITGVEIPTGLFWGVIGFVAGIAIAKSKYVGSKASKF